MSAPKWLTTRCSTCIYYNDGERMHLRPGRVDEMTEQTVLADTNVICHKSASVSGEWPFDAYCHGNMEEKGPGQMARIEGRLGMAEEVNPRDYGDKDDDSG
jgi:hypothetical protein